MDQYKEIIYRWIMAYMTSMGMILWGKNSPSPPPPPDPGVVAAAQTQQNQQSAAYQTGLNRPNVYTPLGSQVFTPANAAASGANMPQFNEQINLTPQGQQLYGQQLQQQLGMSGVANQLLPQVSQGFQGQLPSSQNISDATKTASDAFYNQQKAYLDPQFNQQEESLKAQLANQGLAPGGEAYTRSMGDFNRAKDFAYNQAQQGAITQGPGVAGQNLQLLAAQRSLPLNELSALMSGSQVQMPQFAGSSPSQVNPANYGQYAYGSYGGLQDIYNQQVGTQNANTSGMVGLAGTGLMVAAVF